MKYQKLDELILGAVKDSVKPIRLAGLGKCVWDEARALEGEQQAFRAIDRRLQALRKSGKIRHNATASNSENMGWVLC